MAVCLSARHLALIVLSSWNVHCSPLEGWRHHIPEGETLTNMEAPIGQYQGSSQSGLPPFPPQPWDMHDPAVSFLYDPEEEGGYATSETLPVVESATTDTASMISQPRPGVGLPPPPPPPYPPMFQAGELEQYAANAEYSNLDTETEELSLPPPPPDPDSDFQAGEFSHYESIFEHGNKQDETQELGYMPYYETAPLEAEKQPASLTFEAPEELPVHQQKPLGNLYYYFLTGQLPHGTQSQLQSEFETGRDYWNDVHYERYHYPVMEDLESPFQAEVPSDELWLEPEYAKVDQSFQQT